MTSASAPGLGCSFAFVDREFPGSQLEYEATGVLTDETVSMPQRRLESWQCRQRGVAHFFSDVSGRLAYV